VLEDVKFLSNVASDSGGAIYQVMSDDGSGVLAISQSEFVGNTATSNSGGAIEFYASDSATGNIVLNRDSFVANTAGQFGGGLDVFVEDSTSQIFAANSTFLGNGSEEGGAMMVTKFGFTGVGETETVINNTTFSANRADGGLMGYGNAAAFSANTFGSPFFSKQKVTLSNTIAWGDLATGTGSPEVQSLGSDVTIAHTDIEGGCPAGISCVGVIDVDPAFGAPGYYFGSTQVVRPSATSPVLDAADDATCEAFDQRGIARPQGDHCDMGAVELRKPSDDISYPGGF
jgi:hypothetical protein